MKKHKTIFRYLGLSVGLFIMSDSNSYSQAVLDTIPVVKKGATLKEVSRQFTFTEGPAADKLGNIYFTDQPNDKIWKFDTEGNLSVFMDKTGNIIACADEKNELWRITPDKKITVLLKGEEGKNFNGPNDLWLDSKGGIYFTDPYYQRNYWTRKKPELSNQSVYYLPKGKKTAILIDSTLKQPNGIIGTADGKHLFVADIADNKTYKYEGFLLQRVQMVLHLMSKVICISPVGELPFLVRRESK
jgi:gluconolactonase